MMYKSVIALVAASAALAPSVVVAGPVRRFDLGEIVDGIKNIPDNLDSAFDTFTENVADGVDVIASAVRDPSGIDDAVESVFNEATSNVAENFASITSNVAENFASVTSDAASVFASVTSEIGSDPTASPSSASSNSDDDEENGGGRNLPSTMMFSTVVGGILLGSLYVL